MSRRYAPRRGLALAAVFAICAGQALALDLDVGLALGNMSLPWGFESHIPDPAYPSNLFTYNVEAHLIESFSDSFSLETSFIMDPIVHSILRSVVSYESGYITVSAGPLLGLFNTIKTPVKAGISAGLRFDLPGIVFLGANVDSSLGATISAEGDYSQEMARLSLGWYGHNVIYTASILTRRFLWGGTSGDLYTDMSNTYSFSLDMFNKTSPYHLTVTLGYEDLSRTYPDAFVDKLGFIILGARLDAQLSRTFGLRAEMLASPYAFGMEGLVGRGPAPTALMFRSFLGIVLKLGADALPPPADDIEEATATGEEAGQGASAEEAAQTP
ncbi:MAG: hypothetical protein JW923_02470 [Spirochaetales bacterium]|nr:hypothetical protein [Spirochaetales bacterium]MBP7264724.1 hypothetical protein [Spirochaetia bacterium]